MPNAFDLDQQVTSAMIPRLKAAGIVAVGLYSRILTADMAKLLSAAGIYIFTLAEWAGAQDYASYTAERGINDATLAARQAKAAGQPAGTTIFHCFDFDAIDVQIAAGCTEYQRAAAGVYVGTGYSASCYGNGAVCQALLGNSLAEHAMVWGADDTNGTQAFIASNKWAIRQYPPTTEFGVGVDPDQINGDPVDCGCWILPT